MSRILTLLGAPSITLLALIVDVATRRRLFPPRDRQILLSFTAALALILYSSTLGYVPFDVYRFGFSPWAPVALAAVAIAIAFRSLPLACTALAALIAYDIPLFRSVNLFDYVVDPMVGAVAVGWAVGAGVGRLMPTPSS